eukprot:11844087-Alexandrium_andersonii.AAC.1
MSASLVGSEMCIRDRHRAASLAKTWVGWQLQESAAARTSCWPLGLRNGSCLLYTSDAADDM